MSKGLARTNVKPVETVRSNSANDEMAAARRGRSVAEVTDSAGNQRDPVLVRSRDDLVVTA